MYINAFLNAHIRSGMPLVPLIFAFSSFPMRTYCKMRVLSVKHQPKYLRLIIFQRDTQRNKRQNHSFVGAVGMFFGAVVPKQTYGNL